MYYLNIDISQVIDTYMAKRGEHLGRGFAQCEIIKLLSDKDLKTGEIISAIRKNLNINEARGIRAHLSTLEKDGLIISDKDSPAIPDGKATKGEMKKELVYSIPDSFESMYKILIFVENVDRGYLKKVIASRHYMELSKGFMASMLESLTEDEGDLGEKLFTMFMEDLNEISWDEDLYKKYVELYKKFNETPRDLVQILTKLSLTFPASSKFIVSAMAIVERLAQIKENVEDNNIADAQVVLDYEKLKEDYKEEHLDLNLDKLVVENKEVSEKRNLLNQKIDSFLDFLSPDPYAITVYRDVKGAKPSLLFLMSLMTNMIKRMDRFNAIMSDSLLHEGIFPEYMSNKLIKELGGISWEIVDDVPFDQLN